MQDWTQEQFKRIVSQWDDSIATHYPQHLESWRNPEVHFEKLTHVWNLLPAAKKLDWNAVLLGQKLRVLDMGAGTGWLSAYLSGFDCIERIHTLDSSKYFLSVMAPAIIGKMNGKIEKIELIEGLFSPILFESETIDVVVASSSLHHAENLPETLSEIHRVLKRNGRLIILNETPESWWQYFMNTARHFKEMCKKTLLKRYEPRPVQISASCILYDPKLGDKSYPLWYWKEALTQARFTDIQVQVTDMPTSNEAKDGPPLTHFICKKSG